MGSCMNLVEYLSVRPEDQIDIFHCRLTPWMVLSIQATTAIVDTVIVESTALVEQKPLTTQFYLLLVESPL